MPFVVGRITKCYTDGPIQAFNITLKTVARNSFSLSCRLTNFVEMFFVEEFTTSCICQFHPIVDIFFEIGFCLRKITPPVLIPPPTAAADTAVLVCTACTKKL